jgi:16S rRNA (guanine(966)-N(2))-methyltransferase RsmD
MSGLRVISGKARGRKLRSVPGETTRPITDLVKEALFNILGPDIQDAIFLDLFAGTGSVGIEAISRGAKFVRFVDIHRLPIKTVRANLAHTGLEDRAEVLHMDAFTLLESTPDHVFDYVYIAPPQYQGLWKHAVLALDTHHDWLSEDAWVIAQIHPVEYEPLQIKALSEFDQRNYGSTLLVFYQFSLPSITTNHPDSEENFTQEP